MSKEITIHIGNGGRVKSAGVPMDHLFDPGETFINNTAASVAVEIAQQYRSLRHGPPEEIRDRIFPRSGGSKELFRSAALLTRPILKTDQGAGQFLAFEVGNGDRPLRFSIATQSGYCIEESFFQKQLVQAGYPREIMLELEATKGFFAVGNLKEAQLAYERLQIAAEKNGISTDREADVGRNALFFIRPSVASEPITVSLHVMENVKNLIAEHAGDFSDLAYSYAKHYAQKNGFTTEKYHYKDPIYFQADIQIFPDGTCVLDQLQLPDLGLFITTLDPQGNIGVSSVKAVTLPLAEQVIAALDQKIRSEGKDDIYIATRKAVLENDEDVLEQREILAITERLRDAGVKFNVISPDQIHALSKDDFVVMLNVDTASPAYDRILAHQLLIGGPQIYPDPFLKRALDCISGYTRVSLSQEQVTNISHLISSVDLRTNPENSFRATLALDSYLRRLGVDEDVFHVHISSQPTPIACYRYDVRGVQIAMGYVSTKDTVYIRNVPISPDRAVLFHQERALYNVFRFMVTMEDV